MIENNNREENWIEMNSKKDIPKDRDKYFWFVNRTNKYVFLSKIDDLLGKGILHKTFSHYMPVDLIEPKPPKNIIPLPEGTKAVMQMNAVETFALVDEINKK